MVGFVELLAEHQVRGWAFDEATPDRHLPVAVTLDGVQIGAAIADLARPDLRTAGIGAGDHGFHLTFPQPIPPALLGRIKVWAGDSGGRFALKFLPTSNRSMADHASNPAIPFADASQHPVFVLGPARSGTSAVALALLNCGRYQGSGEGHLLPLAFDLLMTIQSYYARRSALNGGGTLLGSVHPDTFQRMVRRGFVQLTRAAYSSGYWIDKTPTAEMVRAAPLLQAIWPNARFVFLKRRVIENVHSRRRKFAQTQLVHHYRDWASVLTAWLSARPALGDAAIEVDQIELARFSDEVAERISRFLDIPPPFAEVFRAALAADHPEQTSETFGHAKTLDSLNLSVEEKRGLMETCGPVMDAYGYSYDETYYRDRPLPRVPPGPEMATGIDRSAPQC
jgi:Sulfotransferase family